MGQVVGREEFGLLRVLRQWVDIPHTSANPNDGYVELNNLVCGAYAWYWSISGDDTYLKDGDACFDAGISPRATVYFTGKDFGQIFKSGF